MRATYTSLTGPIRHVIIDRDGTMNRELPEGWLSRPEQWEWERGSLEALKLLARTRIVISVVTNQSGVGRGVVSRQEVDGVHDWLRAELALGDVRLRGIYVCPHAPGAGCDCRKPRPGLVHRAMAASGVGLDQTILVGDDARDLEAGRAAGVRVALVCTGKGERFKGRVGSETPVFDSLLQAAVCIAGDDSVATVRES